MTRDVEEGFAWFFRAQFPRVVSTVYLILHDHGHAEEIAQDAFIQLFERWTKISRYEQPEAWVRRVAIRMAVRHARRERLRNLLERRGDGWTAPDDVPVDVHAAVLRLPPAQRAAVVLFYFEDRPISEIADFLGCTRSTAKVHLHKARQRLASLLKEEIDDVL
ncbi:RNA polymerase sigma factor [Nonomuraea turcica]|uniref:RNA polymerase sigma factor n=1 Tax=Nonomuraea sp. G32 TaxID=3067274 RepID=UPI00273BE1C6|nr:SigE family RNA polymerase sigma factor [Nonomuraea sp. G32]MDP4501169.1 SigE family RNA polymerase sigma factor [Nonomuraea sp. G32]